MDVLNQDGSPYINEIELQPPSPPSVPLNLSPQHSPFDSFDFNQLGSPPFPHTPSYNGSYQNSPYSGHSELSFTGENDSFGLFDDEQTGLSVQADYDPSEYDSHHTSSLLMFNENDYLRPFDSNPISVAVTPVPDSRLSYDYSSPSSNGGGDSGGENERRSRASSVSSNPHISPSPRLDVTHTFENMRFDSPNWRNSTLPRDRSVSPHTNNTQSPPRLLMPDSGSSTGPSFPQPPIINAPEGDGGLMAGPRLHIVPATPVSGGGAASQSVPFQTTLGTLQQGATLNSQQQTSSWDHQPQQMNSNGESMGAPQFSDQSQGPYKFPQHSHDGTSSAGLSGSGSQINNTSNSNLNSNTNFLFPIPSRTRSKSDNSLEPPNWDPDFIGHAQMSNNDVSALDDGTVNMNDVLPGSGHLQQRLPQHLQHHSSSAGSHQTAFNMPSQPNLGLMPFGSNSLQQHPQHRQLPINNDNYLSPDSLNLRRCKSDSANRPTHRQSRSEDVRGTTANLLFPPSSHEDFINQNRQFLSPQEMPSIRGHFRRASSGTRSERGASAVASWSGGSSTRPSPYPSPNASPRPRYDDLPNVPLSGQPISNGGETGLDNSGGGGVSSVVKQNVTTGRTANASHRRRKQEATFVCPVPGCGSTFTRSFNLKGHIRSHNEEKPFLCPWPGCSKGFARQHDCKRHEQLHTNYRPFTCEGCNKQFARMDALNRHLRSEGGAECHKTLEMNGTMPDLSGGSSAGEGSGHGRSVSQESSSSLSMPVTKTEDGWPNMSVTL